MEKAPIGLGVIYACPVITYLQRVWFLCSILWVFHSPSALTDSSPYLSLLTLITCWWLFCVPLSLFLSVVSSLIPLFSARSPDLASMYVAIRRSE